MARLSAAEKARRARNARELAGLTAAYVAAARPPVPKTPKKTKGKGKSTYDPSNISPWAVRQTLMPWEVEKPPEREFDRPTARRKEVPLTFAEDAARRRGAVRASAQAAAKARKNQREQQARALSALLPGKQREAFIKDLTPRERAEIVLRGTPGKSFDTQEELHRDTARMRAENLLKKMPKGHKDRDDLEKLVSVLKEKPELTGLGRIVEFLYDREHSEEVDAYLGDLMETTASLAAPAREWGEKIARPVIDVAGKVVTPNQVEAGYGAAQAAGIPLPDPGAVRDVASASVGSAIEAGIGIGPGTVYAAANPEELPAETWTYIKDYYGRMLSGDLTPLEEQGVTPLLLDFLGFTGVGAAAKLRVGALGATRQAVRGGIPIQRTSAGGDISAPNAYWRAAAHGQSPRYIPGTDVVTMGRHTDTRQHYKEAPVQVGETFGEDDAVIVKRAADGEQEVLTPTAENGLLGLEAPHPNDPTRVDVPGVGEVDVLGGVRLVPVAQRMVSRAVGPGRWIGDLYAKTPPGRRRGRQKSALRQEMENERDRQLGAVEAFVADSRKIENSPSQSMAFTFMLRHPDNPLAAIDAEIETRLQRGLTETKEQQEWIKALTEARAIVADPSEALIKAVTVGRGIAEETQQFLITRGLLRPETAERALVAAQRWLEPGALRDKPLESPHRSAIEDTLRDQFEDTTPLAMAWTDAAARAWGKREGRDPVEWYDEFIGDVQRVSKDEMDAHLAELENAALTQIRDLDVVFDEAKIARNQKRAERVRANPELRKPAQNKSVLRKINGRMVQIIGKITPKNWVKRVDSVFDSKELRRELGINAIGRPFKSKKEAIDYYAKWYDHYEDLFRQIFGDKADEMMRGFAVSQANASPTGGLQAVFRVGDKLRRGEKIGPKEISVVAQGIEAAMKGDPIHRFVAAKLSDFVDSLQGKRTRTWMGDIEAGGEPAAIDIHAMRDLGRVDKKILRRLQEMGITDATVDVGGSPTVMQYETMVLEYEEIANHLNNDYGKRGFNGRKDWTPQEAQALGWSTIQLLHGVIPEDLGFAVRSNTRSILFEVTKGTRGLGSDLTAQEANAVIAAVMPDIEEIVAYRGGLNLGTRVHIGGWGDGTEASAAIEIIGSPETIEAIAHDLAVAYDQEEVVAVRGGGADNRSKASFEIFNPAFDDTKTADLFWTNLREAIKAAPNKRFLLNNLQGFQIIRNRQGQVGIRIVTKQKPVLIDSAPGDSYYDSLSARFGAVLDKAARDTNLAATVDIRNTSIIRADGWNKVDEAGPHARRGLDDPALSRARDNLNNAVNEVRGARPARAAEGELPEPGVVRGGPRVLEESLRQAAGRDLEGLPARVDVPGPGRDWDDPIEWHSNGELQSLAETYARDAGLEYVPIRVYADVNPRTAERVGRAFEEMVHAPDDPAVIASYQAFKQETLAQYRTLEQAGYRFEFMPEGADPYSNSPRLAQADFTQNKRLYVFSTEEGYGRGGITDAQRAENPLLEETGLEWDGRPVLFNDLFRAVHDVFGHFKEGVGFRAAGEENAWRSHSAMYSEQARGAMTTETRGQNSWLNYGPYGALNRRAKTYATVFSDQKIGLMPEWTWTDGAADPTVPRALEQRRTVTTAIETEQRTFGAVILKREGADVLLDEDIADLATWVHETFHIMLPDWLKAADAAGDARANAIREHIGLNVGEDLTPAHVDQHEVFTRAGELWVRRGALPAPQLRELFNGLSEEMKRAYRQAARSIARSPEEAALIERMMEDPAVTSFFRDMFDVAPLREFDPSVAGFSTMQNVGRLGGRRGIVRRRFKASVTPERRPPTKGPNTFAAYEAGTTGVGPDTVAHYAAAEIRGRVQDMLSQRVDPFSEPFEIGNDGRPILKDGYQVWNPAGVHGANSVLDDMFRHSRRYGELVDDVDPDLSADPLTGAMLDMDPHDYEDLVGYTTERALMQEATAGSIGEMEAKVGGREVFMKMVREGKITQVPVDIMEDFIAASGGNYLQQALGVGVKALGTILKIPNMRARWNMVLKPAYPILNAAQTAILAGSYQGPMLAVHAANSIRLTAGTRARLLSEVGVGWAELTDLPTIPGEGKLARAQRWEQEQFRRTMQFMSRPEARVRLTQLQSDLARAGIRSEEDVIRFLDMAKRNGTKEEQAARAELNQIGRWSEDAVVRFRGMGHEEQMIVRDAIFVYGWIRAATRFALQFPLNRPVAAGIGFHVGQYGWEKMQEGFYELARESWGAIPYSKKKISNDMLVKMIDVSQWLPFKTATDVLTPFQTIMGFGPEGSLREASLADLLSPSAELGLSFLFGEDPRYGTTPIEQIREQYGLSWKSLQNLPVVFWISRYVDPSLTGTKLRAEKDRWEITMQLFGGMAAPYEIKASESYKRWLAQTDYITRTIVREQNDAATLAEQADQAARVVGEAVDFAAIRAINANAAYTMYTGLLEHKLGDEDEDFDRLSGPQRSASRARILKHYFPEAYEEGKADTDFLYQGKGKNRKLVLANEDDILDFTETWDDLWSEYVSDEISLVREDIEEYLGHKAPTSGKLPIERWTRDVGWLEEAPAEALENIRTAMRVQNIQPGNRRKLMPIIEAEMRRVVKP